MLSIYSGQPLSDPFQRNCSDWEEGQGWNAKSKKKPAAQATTTIESYRHPAVSLEGKPVLLRSLLHFGKISYQLEDLQLWDPTFTVPDYIDKILIEQYHDTPKTGVTIVRGIDGALRPSVNPKLIEVSKAMYDGIEIAGNEMLMLKTRILYGQVSFQENDVDFRRGTWQIPQYMVENLKEKYWSTPSGDLVIISDDREQLRMVVKVGAISRVRSAANKRGF